MSLTELRKHVSNRNSKASIVSPTRTRIHAHKIDAIQLKVDNNNDPCRKVDNYNDSFRKVECKKKYLERIKFLQLLQTRQFITIKISCFENYIK